MICQNIHNFKAAQDITRLLVPCILSLHRTSCPTLLQPNCQTCLNRSARTNSHHVTLPHTSNLRNNFHLGNIQVLDFSTIGILVKLPQEWWKPDRKDEMMRDDDSQERRNPLITLMKESTTPKCRHSSFMMKQGPEGHTQPKGFKIKPGGVKSSMGHIEPVGILREESAEYCLNVTGVNWRRRPNEVAGVVGSIVEG
ncbi:hypothetical protein FIBSPDRAFT_896971 [Athelia psychrophila]|uniref:Uncharacterized protein n=1 Tax=Athelia psychrophila TaxID=1759441 RepID=A0A166CUV8_9AGAM|nr:hypothetical protein FIBSPDRAFT_896971 [Fibularhizoctonia sp. CBS 109695]